MAISDYFKNSFETSNVNSDEQLRNHYYGSDVLTTQNQISTTLKRAGFKLMNVDNHYHEMLFTNKKVEVIVTLLEMSMYETGVAMKVNTHYLISFARGKKVIIDIYNLLDKTLVLKSKGSNYAE